MKLLFNIPPYLERLTTLPSSLLCQIGFRNESYTLSSFNAAFISSIVKMSLISNSKQLNFEFNIDDNTHIFKRISKITISKELEISTYEIIKTIEIAEIIGSYWILDAIIKSVDDPKNESEYVQNAIICHYFHKPYDHILEDIAFDFYKTNVSALPLLPYEDIKTILGHPFLKVNYEEEVLDFVINYIESYNKEAKELFSFVRYKGLTHFGLIKFLKAACKYGILSEEHIHLAKIDEVLFSPIDLNRYEIPEKVLTQLVGIVIENARPYKVYDISLVGISFKGMFDTLRRQNLLDSHVSIATSSPNTSIAKCIMDWNSDSHWVSSNRPNGSVTFTLTNCTIKLTGYKIKTHNGPSYPIQWIIQARDENTTKTIDSHSTRVLASPNTSSSFQIQTNFFTDQISITMTGRSSHNDYFFCLRGIEFFGILRIY